MPPVLENVIVSAVPDATRFAVEITWATGERSVNRFGHLVGKGVFAALSSPETFRQVRVGENGRSLEWPGEIDFCADALWFEAHPEDAPRLQKNAAGRAA